MSDKKGIAYYKEWIGIVSFVIVVLAFGAKAVLLTDQVKRNESEIMKLTKELDEADIKLLNYRLAQIEEKLDQIVTYMIDE